jgi:hypothetical protein
MTFLQIRPLLVGFEAAAARRAARIRTMVAYIADGGENKNAARPGLQNIARAAVPRRAHAGGFKIWMGKRAAACACGNRRRVGGLLCGFGG